MAVARWWRTLDYTVGDHQMMALAVPFIAANLVDTMPGQMGLRLRLWWVRNCRPSAAGGGDGPFGRNGGHLLGRSSTA
jgi:hypothetical protein